jgi:hypothetical protein
MEKLNHFPRRSIVPARGGSSSVTRLYANRRRAGPTVEVQGDFWREMREQKLVADDAPLPVDIMEETVYGARIR